MTANRRHNHVPSYPAWSAEQMPEHTAFSMIFVRGAGNAATVEMLRTELTGGPDAPDHLERARIVNADDHETVFLGYWLDPESHLQWSLRSHALGRPGVLQEAAVIPAERWETLYNTPETTPGVRNLRTVELTDTHAYWGSARDRIPASTMSGLDGDLCLIRFGQVWAFCGDSERALYRRDVEPRLAAAVDFLAEHPETGCLSSRLLREQTIDGEDLESTSFVGWFSDLQSLEDWSSTHRTHIAIFNSFLSMVASLDFETELRLWQEVSVIPAGGLRLAGTVASPLATAP